MRIEPAAPGTRIALARRYCCNTTAHDDVSAHLRRNKATRTDMK
ncbi:hypothetical protein [Desulfatitalea alkaliphila]|nr:hypothetical protein [Desulfatitalea alkaliphila]